MEVRSLVGEEKRRYMALAYSLRPLLRGEVVLGKVLGGGAGLEEEVGRVVEPRLEVVEVSSLPPRRPSLSSMASFSWSPGRGSESGDSGVLSPGWQSPGGEHQSSMDGGGDFTGVEEDCDAPLPSPSPPSSTAGCRSSSPTYSAVRRSPSPSYSTYRSPSPSCTYSTVRRSPSPSYSSLRSPSPQCVRPVPPTVPTVLKKAVRPPTQRSGEPGGTEGRPWGTSLHQSSLFPRPSSGDQEVERRRQKRLRNTTQVTRMHKQRKSNNDASHLV